MNHLSDVDIRRIASPTQGGGGWPDARRGDPDPDKVCPYCKNPDTDEVRDVVVRRRVIEAIGENKEVRVFSCWHPSCGAYFVSWRWAPRPVAAPPVGGMARLWARFVEVRKFFTGLLGRVKWPKRPT